MSTLISFSALGGSAIGWEFEGYMFDGLNITFILVNAAYGEGPKLHSHPYTEIFIIQDGIALYTVGDKLIEASAGKILIVPSGIPHKFINKGDIPLRQVDIHLNSKFITNWLEC